MIRLSVIPLKQVGLIEFGMSRAEVRQLADMSYSEFMKAPTSSNLTDDFGAFHVYYDSNDQCEAVEVFSELEVEVMGKLIFPTSLEDALKALPSLQPDGDGLISIADSVGIYAPDGNMESILFSVDGYYR